MTKKIISFLMIFTALLYANKNNFFIKYPLVSNFFKVNNIRYYKYDKLLKNDKYFLLGNEYLFNKSLMTNPIHNKKFSGLPDYKNALKQFELSVDNYKNPVSAYEGLYVIQAYFFNKNYLKLRKKFLKNLIRNNICSGYLNYGNLLLKSNSKKFILKSKNVFNKGYKKCSKNKIYKNIFRTKIATAEWRIYFNSQKKQKNKK